MMVLTLPLKHIYWDMILSDGKDEEYREITPYWMKRLCMDEDYDEPMTKEDIDYICASTYVGSLFDAGWKPKPYTHVDFTLGYPRKDDARRHMKKQIVSITIGHGKPEWGAPKDREVFIIKFKEL